MYIKQNSAGAFQAKALRWKLVTYGSIVKTINAYHKQDRHIEEDLHPVQPLAVQSDKIKSHWILNYRGFCKLIILYIT
jgi:hypothetical protein